MVTLILIVDAVLAIALTVLIIFSRRFVKKMKAKELKPFKTNIIIESSLSLDL